MEGAERAAQGAGDRPRAGQDPLLPRHDAQASAARRALAHLRNAAERYPRDRVVRNQLGRVLFLQRRYPEAIAELEGVLAIDPEDLQAHYNLMLSWQGLGDAANASRAQTLYKRFKADESAQFSTGPYRQLHPEDNNERQSIHEHGRRRHGRRPRRRRGRTGRRPGGGGDEAGPAGDSDEPPQFRLWPWPPGS